MKPTNPDILTQVKVHPQRGSSTTTGSFNRHPMDDVALGGGGAGIFSHVVR